MRLARLRAGRTYTWGDGQCWRGPVPPGGCEPGFGVMIMLFHTVLGGDSALDHTPDERIDLDEFGRAVDVLARTLEILCLESD